MALYCIYVNYTTKYISCLKILMCVVSQNKMWQKMWQTKMQEKSAKNCQSLFNFPVNSISPVSTICQAAFGSNPNSTLCNIKICLSFLNINDFLKSKQRKESSVQLSIHTV